MKPATSDTPVRTYDSRRRMPPMRRYLADTFLHLQFAYEKARLDLKAAHQDTWFGRLWSVLNPLLLASVYWLLIMVIFERAGSDRTGLQVLTQIVGGIFLFRLLSSSLSLGGSSIVNGGSFVLNTRLPRLILPIAAVISASLAFAPSFLIYAALHAAAGYPVGPHLLWILPIVVILELIALGLAAAFATLTVYFRDVSSLLPYVLRLWLYLTPIIYLYDQVPDALSWILAVNPIGFLFAGWQQVLFEGTPPSLAFLWPALIWGVALALAGGGTFIWKERDFAVRI